MAWPALDDDLAEPCAGHWRRRRDPRRGRGRGAAAATTARTGSPAGVRWRRAGVGDRGPHCRHGARLRRAVSRGVLFVHHASGFSLDYSIDPLSAWFLIVLSTLAVPIAIFSIGYARHPPLDGRSVFLGIAFNVLLLSVELVFIAGRRDRIPVCLGADDAGDRGAGCDRARESARRDGRPTCTWSCHMWRPAR